MQNSEPRMHECGQRVAYLVISDADSPETSEQFGYTNEEGTPETGSFCPKCGKELTLENTTRIEG